MPPKSLLSIIIIIIIIILYTNVSVSNRKHHRIHRRQLAGEEVQRTSRLRQQGRPSCGLSKTALFCSAVAAPSYGASVTV